MQRKSFRSRRRSQRGFTLIELMVSLVLFAFVTAGMLSVAVTMARGFREQESTISTESATRATLDFLAEATRGASPGVSGLNITTEGCGTNSLEILNNQPIPGLGTHTSDRLTMVYPAGGVYSSLTVPYTKGDVAMTLLDGAGQLSTGDQLLVTDFVQGHVVTLTAPGNGGTGVVQFNADGCANPATYTYGRGSVVIRVKHAAFYIGMLPTDVLNPTPIPALMMDSTPENLLDQATSEEPVAEGVEDLQVAVAIDGADADINITELGAAAGDDEWEGNVNGEVIPALLNTLSVRAIRISLIARSTHAAPGINFYTLPALEDRAAVATNDNFRRRTLSTIIEMRNVGFSP